MNYPKAKMEQEEEEEDEEKEGREGRAKWEREAENFSFVLLFCSGYEKRIYEIVTLMPSMMLLGLKKESFPECFRSSLKGLAYSRPHLLITAQDNSVRRTLWRSRK